MPVLNGKLQSHKCHLCSLSPKRCAYCGRGCWKPSAVYVLWTLFTEKLPLLIPGDRPKNGTCSGRGLNSSGKSYVAVLLQNPKWVLSSRQSSLPLLQPPSLNVYGIVEAAEEGMLLAEACGSRKTSYSGRNEDEWAAACLWKKESLLCKREESCWDLTGEKFPLFKMLTSLREKSWSLCPPATLFHVYHKFLSPDKALPLLTALHNAQLFSPMDVL